MSSLRYDAATHDWVVYAPERGQRPRELETSVTPPPSAPPILCPFCPGQEGMKAPEVLRVPDESGTGWSVRIIPNKFPAVDRMENPRHQGPELFERAGGYGVHEVIVESPEHEGLLANQPARQAQDVLWSIRERFRILKNDPNLRSILAFKNHGEGAGTSLRHPHWQLIATSVVPRMHRVRHSIAEEYYDRTDRCLYCDLLAGELADGARIVAENSDFVAVAPFASHVPYQIRILPRRHAASFISVPDRDLPPLAGLMRNVLHRLYVALGNPAFNLTLNTAPVGDEEKRYFLWHMDILPRLSTPGGFEMGSGMAVNTTLPETAAAKLRKVPEP